MDSRYAMDQPLYKRLVAHLRAIVRNRGVLTALDVPAGDAHCVALFEGVRVVCCGDEDRVRCAAYCLSAVSRSEVAVVSARYGGVSTDCVVVSVLCAEEFGAMVFEALALGSSMRVLSLFSCFTADEVASLCDCAGASFVVVPYSVDEHLRKLAASYPQVYAMIAKSTFSLLVKAPQTLDHL